MLNGKLYPTEDLGTKTPIDLQNGLHEIIIVIVKVIESVSLFKICLEIAENLALRRTNSSLKNSHFVPPYAI
jgi:hypothetical protein